MEPDKNIMDTPVPRYRLSDLASRAADPWALEPFSAALEHPCLVLDLDETKLEGSQIAAFAERLSRMPCPVIGVRGSISVPAVLAQACDVLLDDHQDLPALLRNIGRHAVAAAVLVQVLRHNERCGPYDGLLMESFAYSTLQTGADFRRYLAQYAAATPISAGEESPLLLDREEDRLTITFNRPHARNAYSVALRDAFYEALQLMVADSSIASARICGSGDCFCTGGDLAEFGLATDPAQAHVIRQSRSVALLLAQLSGRIEFHVHRACIGSGIELPAFAGRVVATPNTIFQLPEISMGLIPGAGGTVSIPQRIGRQRTAYLALSTRRINASCALAWGLIDAIVEPKEVSSPRKAP